MEFVDNPDHDRRRNDADDDQLRLSVIIQLRRLQLRTGSSQAGRLNSERLLQQRTFLCGIVITPHRDMINADCSD